MKNITRVLIISLLSLFMVQTGYAEKYKGEKGDQKKSNLKSTAAGCLPGSGFKYLDVNNVRCRINTGGDMWWDFENADYEIPRGSRKTSMFSASLWIGGVDANDQLKLAAVRYRQGPDFGGGNDYWPGPLTIDGSASIEPETCEKYDRLFPITRKQIDNFNAWWDNKQEYPNYNIPTEILEWPAHGDITKGQSYYLAPFFDRDGDGTYNPLNGDYPYYDLDNDLCKSKTPTVEDEQGIVEGGILADQVIKGDETLWWVFNDKGNIHTETEGQAIGLEIRGQAFGFSTNDVINNMTFYSYEIINRSTFTLRDTYFSQWVDTDLGFATDDYIGCDVERGLGYCYNGKPVDGNGQYFAYGEQPPAVGVDFFQGPYVDPDGKDNAGWNGDNCEEFNFNLPAGNPDDGSAINGVNFGDGIVDNERFGMRRFVYHNNTGVPDYMTDPDYAPEYYNFLRGIWKDGTKMIYGGNAHQSSGAYGPECDFMFPGDSDPCNWGTDGLPPNGPVYWTEETADNQEHDRRFMQSAGPFELKPGAVNYITVGIPWARATSGGPFASVELLRVVDDVCQKLFDNCFDVIDGPNAPDLTVREMNQELVFYITNRKTNDPGSNYNEQYEEYDPYIDLPHDSLLEDVDRDYYDTTYNFEGYQVFQLANPEVSVSDLDDPNKAREVFQCDIKNDVTTIINHYFDESLDANVPVQEVAGTNKGIRHSFTLQIDAFSGEPLVNHKQYYYLALSYAHNNYMTYSADPQRQEPGIIGIRGQKEPYLAGRKNIRVYTAIPHQTVGQVQPQSKYGDGVEITRIQGHGNGGNILELSEETEEAIVSKPPYDPIENNITSENYPAALEAKYKEGAGPIDIKIIDPLNVKNAEYTIRFDSMVAPDWGGKYANVSKKWIDTANIRISNWTLIDEATGKGYKSDTAIIVEDEVLFLDLGFSINIKQEVNPFEQLIIGTDTSFAEGNGFIESSIDFADSSKRWLTGLADTDDPNNTNWIRSGSGTDPDNPAFGNDWNLTLGSSGTPQGTAWDPDGEYEKVVGGTWAPYYMVAQSEYADLTPAYRRVSKEQNNGTLSSVDVVITSDKSKWTRCPVIEMSPDASLSEGGVEKYSPRAGQSVDKDGNPAPVGSGPSDNPADPNYIAETGMGWFPGYAINVETGERLNMMFGENSWLVKENGRDMMWNPTSNVLDENSFEYVFGGMHYVYVMGHRYFKQVFADTYEYSYDNPPYDAGKSARYMLDSLKFPPPIPEGLLKPRDYVYGSCLWVNIPISVEGKEFMSSDARIRLRVQKPYQRYSVPVTELDSMYTDGRNNNYPMYEFSTEGVSTRQDAVDIASSKLDQIGVVPNPYYAYSTYETNQLDNRVKIINLPRKCTITIYSIDGNLIRQFTKDEEVTFIDWDLKNFAGIPIAGGLYLIHIDAPGIGQKVVKWFGSLRPIDLNAF
ncbi:MAG: T9SS type A sorting domain-containing protein [Bacteroidales bacterium]|nr:T9SS type A sorting domain-containing protein [Bacteroidales bacterium]